MPERFEIARPEVRFTADNAQLLRAVRENTEALNRQNQSFAEAGQAASAFATHAQVAIAALTAIATTAVVGAVREFAAFEQTMNRVQVTIGATQQEFVALSNLAKELGSTTRFSANEAAGGLQFLAQAGFTANEALGALPSTLQLATIGGLDLASASDIATNILTGFGEEVNQLSRVVDVMANTAQSANTNVGQLGVAFSFAAPAARALNVQIEEAAAVIGILSNAGIQGARAGTGLRQIMLALTRPVGQAAAALQEAGLSAEDYDVRAQGLIQVLNNLAEANLTLEQATAVFNTRNASSVLAITRQRDALRELVQSNREAEGSAAEAARTLEDDLIGSVRNVTSAISGLSIETVELTGVGDQLKNTFFDIASSIRVVLADVQEADSVFRLLGEVATLGIRGLGEAFGLLIRNVDLLTNAVLGLALVWSYRRFALPIITSMGTINASVTALQLGLLQARTAAIALSRAFVPLAVGGAIVSAIVYIIELYREWNRLTELLQLNTRELNDRLDNLTENQLEQQLETLQARIESISRELDDPLMIFDPSQLSSAQREVLEISRVINNIQERLQSFRLTRLADEARGRFQDAIGGIVTPEPLDPELLVRRDTVSAETRQTINATRASLQELARARQANVRALEDEVRLIGLQGAEYEAQAFRIQAENALQDRRVELTDAVREAQRELNAAIEDGAAEDVLRELNANLRAAKDEQTAFVATTDLARLAIEREADEVRRLTQALIDNEERLQAAKEEQIRLTEEATRAEEARARALQTQLDIIQQQVDLRRSVEDAGERTLEQLRQRIELAGLEGGALARRRFELEQEARIQRELLQARRSQIDAQRRLDDAVARGASDEHLMELQEQLQRSRQEYDALVMTARDLPELIRESAERIEELGDRAQEIEELQSQIRQISGAVSQFLGDVVSGTKSVEDAFRDLANRVLVNVISRFIEAQVEALLLNTILGGQGAGSGGGGLGGLLGGLFGGSRQLGGPVNPGQAFAVGESGPELFVPPSVGTIIPNNQLGGAGQALTFVFAPNVPRDEQGMRRAIRSTFPQFEAQVRSGLTRDAGRNSQFQNSIRSGGRCGKDCVSLQRVDR